MQRSEGAHLYLLRSHLSGNMVVALGWSFGKNWRGAFHCFDRLTEFSQSCDRFGKKNLPENLLLRLYFTNLPAITLFHFEICTDFVLGTLIVKSVTGKLKSKSDESFC